MSDYSRRKRGKGAHFILNHFDPSVQKSCNSIKLAKILCNSLGTFSLADINLKQFKSNQSSFTIWSIELPQV